MQPFKNVLVGIDFSQLLGSDKAEFKPPVEQAIQRAIWLAGQAAAKLTFFAALHPRGDLKKLISTARQDELEKNVEHTAQHTLAILVDRARGAGVQAESMIARGKAWVEIIRQTVQGNHDLVVVGTRDVGALTGLLMGTTAMNLIRECPATVWVAKPKSQLEPRNVLVAADLTEMSSRVIELGLALRPLGAKNVDVLHVVDFPLDRMWSTGLHDEESDRYHNEMRDRAKAFLAKALEGQLGGKIPEDVRLHVVDGSIIADSGILEYIDQHDIDLLVIGAAARHELTGLGLGHTAERVLRHIPCSLLAVKSADFRTQVSLD